MAEPSAGTLIGGDFRLLSPLGAGGMGVVWVAEQLSTGILRALKLLRPELVSDETQLNRFLNEARIGARIPSDHVVQVLGAGHDEVLAVPWLAMELLEGVSLGGYLRANERMQAADAYEALAQLCHALGAGHARGVVHRDIKPENVFLSVPRREGARFTVKVLDFGIAKLLSPGGQTTTVPLGSPIWMSPEQTEAHTNVTPATDVWALGLVTFRMLAGKHFWMTPQLPNGSITSLMREIVLEPIPPASARGAALGCGQWLPPGFDAWFAKCVCREVHERFPDATAAKQAFDALVANWEPARTQPPGAFAFGDIPHHTVGPAAQRGAIGSIGPSGSSVSGAPPAMDQFGTSVPVSFGNTSATAGGALRFSATDWGAKPPSPWRVPLVLAGLGAGAVLVLAVAGIVGWQVYAATDASDATAPPGMPAAGYDMASNSASVAAGKKEPGSYISAYTYLEMSKSGGLTFAEAGDRCHAADLHGTGNSLCTPAQWRFACEQNTKIGDAEVWVGSLVSNDEALVCGGSGDCKSCRKVSVDSKSGKRRAPCCSSAPLIRNKNPARELGAVEAITLTMVHGNRYSTAYGMAFPYFAPSVDWYDSKGLSADAAQKLVREHQAKNKADWSVEEECAATEGTASGIALIHDCRRTVRTGKEIAAIMTWMEYQRAAPGSDLFKLRSVQDTAVLFRVKR